MEAFARNIFWEVVMFYFLFCFKKKRLTKRENFLNEKRKSMAPVA